MSLSKREGRLKNNFRGVNNIVGVRGGAITKDKGKVLTLNIIIGITIEFNFIGISNRGGV